MRAAISWVEGRRFLMRRAFSAREVFLGLGSQPRELSGWAGMSQAVGPKAVMSQGAFTQASARVAPRHPPQSWAGIHKPFRLAGVPRQRV